MVSETMYRTLNSTMQIQGQYKVTVEGSQKSLFERRFVAFEYQQHILVEKQE